MKFTKNVEIYKIQTLGQFMKKSLLFLLLPFCLSAKTLVTDEMLDGLCELYANQARAINRSEARSWNSRIHEYKMRFGLQELDERDCEVGAYSPRNYGNRYLDYDNGYIGGYYDGRRDEWNDSHNGRSYRHLPNPQDPWNDRGRSRMPNPQNPWD